MPPCRPKGELRFENAADAARCRRTSDGYALRWSRFDNPTDTHTSVGDEVTVTDARGRRRRRAVLQGSDYVSVRIATRHSAFPSWTPVQVYFRRTPAGWQTVGLDRGLDPS